MPRLVTEIDQVLVQNHAWFLSFRFTSAAQSSTYQQFLIKGVCRSARPDAGWTAGIVFFFFLLPLELKFLAGACPPRDFLWVESVAIIDPLCKTVILDFAIPVGLLRVFNPRKIGFYPNNIFLSINALKVYLKHSSRAPLYRLNHTRQLPYF